MTHRSILTRFTRALVAGAALITSTPALAGDTAAEVRALLDEMQRSVLAGDQKGYLACTDATDPVFAMEQVHWAADLARHLPASFVLAVDEVAERPEGLAVGTLTTKWKMETPEASERTLTYRATFRREPAAPKGWVYSGENWNITEAAGCKVFYADGLEEVAQRVAEVLPEVRAHVHEGFGITINRVQQVKLYSSMKHLQESIYLSYTDGLAGWNEPEEAVKILSSRRSGKGELKMLLAHEYGHVATFELGPKANEMPWWILEGVAELSAEAYANPKGVDGAVRHWAMTDSLAAWDRLSDFRNTAPGDMGFVYTQGHHMIGYISDRFGREKRTEWLRSMSNGTALDAASAAVLGLSFNDLDEQWRASLKVPKKQESTPTPAPATPGT